MTCDNSTVFQTIATLILDADLPIFSDHFPNKPIYPAFLQFAWIRKSLQEPALSFHQVKFFRSATPKMTLYLQVNEVSTEKSYFQISDSLGVITKGRYWRKEISPYQGATSE